MSVCRIQIILVMAPPTKAILAIIGVSPLFSL